MGASPPGPAARRSPPLGAPSPLLECDQARRLLRHFVERDGLGGPQGLHKGLEGGPDQTPHYHARNPAESLDTADVTVKADSHVRIRLCWVGEGPVRLLTDSPEKPV